MLFCRFVVLLRYFFVENNLKAYPMVRSRTTRNYFPNAVGRGRDPPARKYRGLGSSGTVNRLKGTSSQFLDLYVGKPCCQAELHPNLMSEDLSAIRQDRVIISIT